MLADPLAVLVSGAVGGGAGGLLVWWRLRELERRTRYHGDRLHDLETIATAVLIHIELPLPAGLLRRAREQSNGGG